MLLSSIKTSCTKRCKHLLNMRLASCLDHQLNLNVLRGQQGEGTLMMDFINVGARLGNRCGYFGQCARYVPHVDRDGASLPARTMPRSMMGASNSGSMLPPHSTRPIFFPA